MAGRERQVVVVGAGIGGLVAALSLHEIGARVDVYESVRDVRPLGVGINLLPHAVRELDALSLLEPLQRRSIAPQTLVYCSRHGQEIWREPRGVAAGYPWPQLSIHRGVLQQILLDAFVDRVGATTSTSVTDWCGSTPTPSPPARCSVPRRPTTSSSSPATR